MKEQIISFETAKLAKEKGFPQPVNNQGTCTCEISIKYGYLDGKLSEDWFLGFVTGHEVYLVPTQSLLQKWLREEHSIHVNCVYSTNKGIIEDYQKGMYFWGIIEFSETDEKSTCFNTYEEALEAGLYEALKLIKNGK
jgi:hypothetical protein